jgi:hypothetical protein
MPSLQLQYPLTLAEVLFEELETTRPNLDETEPGILLVKAKLKEIEDLHTEEQVAHICQREEIRVEASSDNLADVIWACRQALSSKLVPELYQIIHRLPEKRSALCLSGGGVQNADLNLGVIQALIRAGPEAPHLRSATFNLGILQGLARGGLLDKFDYLSTVSGGGFIGSWLTAWIHREKGNVSAVASQLARSPDDPLKPEPEPLHRVRLSAKYLSPQPELFSMDKFTLFAVYLINLVLNWMVFVPVIMAFLILPRIWFAYVKSTHWDSYLDSRTLLAIGFVTAALALGYIGTNLPGSKIWNFQESRFVPLGLLPSVISAMALTTYWFRLGTGRPAAWRFIGFALALGMVPWVFSLLVRLIKREWQGTLAGYAAATLLILGAFSVSGGWIWYVTNVLNLQEYLKVAYFARAYASFAVPLVMLLLTIAVAFVAGFTTRFTDVDDQEWWWRLSVRFLVIAAAWSIFHLLVLFGPALYLRLRYNLFPSKDWTIWEGVKGIGTLIGVISGAIALFGGFSKKSANENDGPSLRDKITAVSMSLSAAILAATLIVFLSVVTNWILASNVGELMARLLGAGMFHPDPNSAQRIIYGSPGRLLVGVMIVMAVGGAVFGRLININRISLHFYWRNRIMRAFLGASRDRSQTPKGLSDFDPRDNIQMHDLGLKPLHLINITLNRGSRERKRDSFTVSPLHSGSYRLGYRDSKVYGGFGGISLATAAAVSAAGVSPGPGSAMTSPIMRFIMIFLNVRLGFWLGNPGIAGGSGFSRFKRPTFNRDSPAQSVQPIFAEALGLTNARSPYVYLSDGGHFENLGLYEMVLRRCQFIVISDASTDPGYRYQSLGQAIRQIRVDLGVPIEMEEMTFGKDLNAEAARENKYCAIGRIRYSAMDNSTGTNPDANYDGALIYIKPSLNGSEPRDVVNYHNENSAFPQDSIAKKEFGDEQFESYRMLGSHMIANLSSYAVDPSLPPFRRFEEQAKLHVGSRG